MRIACESCKEAYTIEDSQVADQPIGAQCPYCGHVQLVRKSDDVLSGALSFEQPPPGMGFGPEPGGAISESMPALSGGGPPPLQNPNLNKISSRDLFGGDSLQSGGQWSGGLSMSGNFSLDSSSLPQDSGYSPSGDINDSQFSGGLSMSGNIDAGSLEDPPSSGAPELELDRGGPGGGGGIPLASGGLELDSLSLDSRSGPGDSIPSASLSSGSLGPVGAEGAEARCQVCGTPLNDQFDRVLGLCEEHQRAKGSRDRELSSGGWFHRDRTGNVAGPIALEQMRARVRDGQFSTEDEFSRDGTDFGPITRFKELAYLASLATAVSSPRSSHMQVSRSRPRILPLLVIMVIFAGLGALAFFMFQERAKITVMAKSLISGDGLSTAGSNPLKFYFADWSAQLPNNSGSASEYLVTAEARFFEDTAEGYKQAEIAYKRALLVDGENVAATAGYAENALTWRYATMSAEELKVIRGAIRHATEKGPKTSAPYRAAAILALMENDLPGCRSGADTALQFSPTDGRARLISAACYLQGNSKLAVEEAEQARRLIDTMNRAVPVLADGLIRLGSFKQAERLLKRQLASEPRQTSVMYQLAVLKQKIGEEDEAEALLRRAATQDDDPVRAKLALADFKLEQGSWSAAASGYREASRLPIAHKLRGSRLYSGWARAALMLNKPDEAKELAEKALSYSGMDAAALLARGEAALMQGKSGEAIADARRILTQRDKEPAALVLKARADLMEGNRAGALESLHTATENNKQSIALRGILARLFLNEGNSSAAFTLMRRAFAVDPTWAGAHDRRPRFEVNPQAVQEAIGAFEKLVEDRNNGPVASASIAMLNYQLENWDQTEEAINACLSVDRSNTMALLYKAQMALDDGDPKRAKALARKLLALEHGMPLAYLTLARAEAAMGKTKPAIRAYEDALLGERGLLSASLELAALRHKTPKLRKASEAEVMRIFKLDPSHREARRLLFELR